MVGSYVYVCWDVKYVEDWKSLIKLIHEEVICDLNVFDFIQPKLMSLTASLGKGDNEAYWGLGLLPEIVAKDERGKGN